MNSSNPKVSVIIPVYNTEKYLSACLDSVLNQTLRDIEIIAVDDCSPDRCGQILDEYASRDDRVKPVHLPENRRQGFARNRGMERSTGKYLYFLDSDDMIEPETLEELSCLADRDNLDAIFFDSKEHYESEELRKAHVPPFSLRQGKYRDEVVTGIELMEDFIRQYEWTSYPQRIFWRKESLQQNGVRNVEGCEHEDEFFAFAGTLTAKRVRYVRKQYFTLRIRSNSVMTSPKTPKNLHGYLMNIYYMNEFIAKRGLHVYAAEANVVNMYNCAISIYEMLKDKYNLEEAFVKEPDKTIYRYFMTHVRLDLGENGRYSINPEALEEIRKYRVAYVYGVGSLGRTTCEMLERYNILMGGFLTNEPENAPSVVMGRNVLGLDETAIPDDAVVIVATNPTVWEEISALLEKRNIPCMSHRKLSAAFPPWAN